MTKRDLVINIANEMGISQLVVKEVVDRTLKGISDSLARGDKVEFRNFGVFKVKSRRGRRGRNPRTGQEVPIPAKRVATFKPGKIMKEQIV